MVLQYQRQIGAKTRNPATIEDNKFYVVGKRNKKKKNSAST